MRGTSLKFPIKLPLQPQFRTQRKVAAGGTHSLTPRRQSPPKIEHFQPRNLILSSKGKTKLNAHPQLIPFSKPSSQTKRT